MKICVAGQGAFGQKHLDALKRIADVEVVSLIGGNPVGTEEVAKKYGIKHWGNDLGEGIARADAVILATPTQMHRAQGEEVMRAGKHVLIEIPIADNVEDSEALAKIAKQTGAKGLVTVAATIGKDGRIKAAKVISGHPMLANAARAAVLQWIYKPTLLNGQPVETETQIQLNFLGEK